ncbi:MAG: PPC domain-containing protein [Planctomycetaceae bacterium]
MIRGLVLSLLLVPATLHAETKVGFRQLGSTTPVVVQRGRASEIQIRSNFTLDGTYKVLFDRPGITAEFLETKPIDAPRSGRGRPGTPFRFRVTVPEDQLLGIYEMRVATKTAVSSVAHLMVTDLPVVNEDPKAENGTVATSMPVDVPSAIAGTCEETEDVDCYRFTATAGQTITFEVFAQRVTEAVHSMQSGNGTYLMDSILTLMTSSGQVLAQNDNHIGGDAFLAYTFPTAGEYVVSVRDARYIGNTKYVYCLQVSDRPYAHTVFPVAVQRGQRQDVQVVGHQLGTSSTATIDTTSENESIGWRTMPLHVEAGETNPVSVLVSEHPQHIAPDGNHLPESAMALTFPVGVSGRFTAPDQTHRFTFTGSANQFIRFDVTAQDIGLPLDAVLEIQDANGKTLVETDDILNTKDPQLHFRCPADGQYTLLLRDLHDRGGERFQYHLSAVPAGPDFELYGEYYYAQLAPGTRMAWFANIIRHNGFTGPVEIVLEDLPEGVSYEPVTIPEGVTDCLINLVADPAAPINASLVRIAGRASIANGDGQPIECKRYGRITCELQTQGGGQARWPIRTSLVGVVEPLDLLNVSAEPAELTLKRGGKAEFTVKIVRNKDFKEPVTLDMAFTYFTTSYGKQLPAGVTLSKNSAGRLAGDTLEGKIVLEATDKAVLVERLPIAAIARVPITFSITTNYATNPIYLTVTE